MPSMPSPTTSISAWRRRRAAGLPAALALLLPTLLVTGCMDDEGEFPPACPQAEILPDAGDLVRYRDTGHDLTDLVLRARITGLSGRCTNTKQATVLRTQVSVGMDVTRGPAAHGREAALAYFVAVTEGERVLDKRVFPLHVEFPPNTDRVRLTGAEVDLSLPTPRGRSGAAYRVVVGYQLTPQELAENRAHPPH